MTERLTLRTTGPDQTREMAAVVAAVLQPGDVVALTGELGAGKTCFVQGAAKELGVAERVTSPSFLLRRDYRGRMPVIHLDVYRLETLQEVVELGYDEQMGTGAPGDDARGVTFVEWGDAMRPLLPTDHLEVELRHPPEALAASDPRGHMEDEAAFDPLGHMEDQAALDPLERARLVRLHAHGDDWRRRLADLAPGLQRFADETAG